MKISIAITLQVHTEQHNNTATGDISSVTAASRLSHCDSPAMNFVFKYKLNSDTNNIIVIIFLFCALHCNITCILKAH